jgi:ferrochelatase
MKENGSPRPAPCRPISTPAYIEALAGSVERAYAGLADRPEVLVVSYHGVPQRYLTEGDPYHCQCQKTSRLLQERLGWPKAEMVTTFQSRFGPEEWLKPYTVEEVAGWPRPGKKRIAVIAPAFSADCIETLEEINEEIKESFEEAGRRAIHLYSLPECRDRAYRRAVRGDRGQFGRLDRGDSDGQATFHGAEGTGDRGD